jgi:hypothetical protein
VTTLAALRTKLNGLVGVDTDVETLPWSQAVRNNAISEGYAELWRVQVWKAATQNIATADMTWIYPLTTMRALWRIEVLDSSGNIVDQYPGHIEDDGAGGYQLVLPIPTAAGFTLRVRGWTAYKSQFSGDADNDDLAAEYNRVPLLKAVAILYRQQLSRYMRYGSRTNAPPEMAITLDQLIASINAAEREFEVESHRLSADRPRVMYPQKVLAT